MNHFQAKLERIYKLLQARGLDALLLQRVSSFAWATDGAASYVNTATTFGAASLLVTQERRYLLTNNIEVPRLESEEDLQAQGWDFQVTPWYEQNQALRELTNGLKLGVDGPFPGAVDLSEEIARMRARLTAEEGRRMAELGAICAQAMQAAVQTIWPGQREQEIAALLALETQQRGAQPIVNLIATDERVFQYRHPLPTDKRLERYAMLVLCGRRQGLVASITRLVHFGPLPDELRRKERAVAAVDAAYLTATRPGKTLGEVFEAGKRAYADQGFSGEWQRHHQGGPAGYEPRELLGTPGSKEVVQVDQAFAWNPSIAGTKSEDTILVGEIENRVVTEIPDWPVIELEAGDQIVFRPAIRVMD